jgi:hypothetical protein
LEKDENLDRLCLLYGKLDDEGKGKLIRLGEELLNSDNFISDEVSCLTTKNGTGYQAGSQR